ncbi:MAG TPA: hypothetical protein VMC41_02950 [Candidatus Nanoarchaeia archaeon]|nr:hypothetical protein [Candidatus Nanoarchaeia archaeon]
MKKYLLVFLAVSSAILGCGNNPVNSGKESATNTMASVPCQCQTAAILAWNKLSPQSAKDNYLCNIALLNYTCYTGKSCKEWVKDRVLKASGLTIPSTASNEYSWNANNDWICGNINGRSTMIQNVKFMDIIQMKLIFSDGSTSPHTAFVFSTDACGMTWLDCNWDYKHNPNFVSLHYVTYSAFGSMAGNRYTIYHIN